MNTENFSQIYIWSRQQKKSHFIDCSIHIFVNNVFIANVFVLTKFFIGNLFLLKDVFIDQLFLLKTVFINMYFCFKKYLWLMCFSKTNVFYVRVRSLKSVVTQCQQLWTQNIETDFCLVSIQSIQQYECVPSIEFWVQLVFIDGEYLLTRGYGLDYTV